MEYTVQKLARLAGISTRTLRYYDEIDILKPARVNSSGYRIYGQSQVDKLQQILFYRELGFSLETIRELIHAPDFDEVTALKQHYAQLLDRREQIDALILNVEKTIASKEGSMTMSDQEKFDGFKKKLVEQNEQQFGEEIRQRYGDQKVDESNQKVLNMTQSEHEQMTQHSEKLYRTLAEAVRAGDPAGPLGQQAADLHRQWLMFHWPEYSKEAHAGLAQMYVDDERFTAHYDEQQPGTARFLRDAIHIYTGVKTDSADE